MNKLLFAPIFIAQLISWVVFAPSDVRARKKRQELRERNLKIYLKGVRDAEL